jgi:hypothetical protein
MPMNAAARGGGEKYVKNGSIATQRASGRRRTDTISALLRIETAAAE